MAAPAPFSLQRGDAAAYLGVSVSTFDRLVASGDLPAPREVAGLRLWLRAELEARVGGGPAPRRRGARPLPDGRPNTVDLALADILPEGAT